MDWDVLRAHCEGQGLQLQSVLDFPATFFYPHLLFPIPPSVAIPAGCTEKERDAVCVELSLSDTSLRSP